MLVLLTVLQSSSKMCLWEIDLLSKSQKETCLTLSALFVQILLFYNYEMKLKEKEKRGSVPN